MLPARFQQIRNRVTAAVDATFAEPVELLFLDNGKADSKRTNVTIDAVLRNGKEHEANAAGGTASQYQSRISAGVSMASISRASYAGPAIRKDDKIRALSRPGQPFWVVRSINDRDAGRLVLILGEV